MTCKRVDVHESCALSTRVRYLVSIPLFIIVVGTSYIVGYDVGSDKREEKKERDAKEWATRRDQEKKEMSEGKCHEEVIQVNGSWVHCSHPDHLITEQYNNGTTFLCRCCTGKSIRECNGR
jgi:hypothetical protein